MKVEYDVMYIEDILERIKDKPDVPQNFIKEIEELAEYDWDCEIGMTVLLIRSEDGIPKELIATDGGEPEDNSFFRDYSWIAGALEKAYKLGQENK